MRGIEVGKREISVGVRGIEMELYIFRKFFNLPTFIIQQNCIYLHHRVIRGRKNIIYKK